MFLLIVCYFYIFNELVIYILIRWNRDGDTQSGMPCPNWLPDKFYP